MLLCVSVSFTCRLRIERTKHKNGTPSRTLRFHEESPQGAVDAPEPADL